MTGTKMASYLCICMNCAQYVKGAIGINQAHLCNVGAAQIKRNVKECKAILSTLIENDETEKDPNQGAIVPPPPPPLPKALQMGSELKAKFDDVHKELKRKLV